MSSGTTFEVERAGCESCAALVRGAIEEIAPVVDVTIDEAADLATVTLAQNADASEEEVDRVLEEASQGSSHGYRVKPGSWRPAIPARTASRG